MSSIVMMLQPVRLGRSISSEGNTDSYKPYRQHQLGWDYRASLVVLLRHLAVNPYGN